MLVEALKAEVDDYVLLIFRQIVVRSTARLGKAAERCWRSRTDGDRKAGNGNISASVSAHCQKHCPLPGFRYPRLGQG